MFLFIKLTTLLLLGAIIAACGSDSYPVDDRAPELRSFHVVDSYLTNSEFEPQKALKISPFIDDGEFELFWEVQPNTVYRAELFIHSRPTPDGALSLTTSWCGPGEDCGNFSYQYCNYQSDFRLECAVPERNRPSRDVNISSLIRSVPEQLYLVLEICDRDQFYCEFQSRSVSFE